MQTLQLYVFHFFTTIMFALLIAQYLYPGLSSTRLEIGQVQVILANIQMKNAFNLM